MIINGFIKSQDLEISAPLIVSDTMNFLEFRFYFQTKEWNGLVKWAHFKQFNLSYDIPLQGDSITAAQGLSLPPGPWKLYIHGSEYVDGEVIQRITTDETSFMVERSGCGQGGPLPIVPASVGEQLEARIAKLEQGGGGQGVDGKTPYIQDGYWYIDGVNTNVKAEGTDGKDGKDGAPGKDGKDGAPGKDGKDGESVYEIWLKAGHTGSEDDFLQWLKGDTEPFGDVVASIGCGGIAANTSLKGKTIKDVLTMLLGIVEAPQSIVEQIIEHSIPAYSGTINNQVEAVEYARLEADTANYLDQGFYTTVDASGNVTRAGYQLTIEGNNNADAQVIAIPADAVIKMAYRYDLGGTNTWLAYTFDTTDEANYWLEGEQFTATVNGQEVVYQTYIYNIDVVGGGDAITSTEYWRFEIEVKN